MGSNRVTSTVLSKGVENLRDFAWEMYINGFRNPFAYSKYEGIQSTSAKNYKDQINACLRETMNSEDEDYEQGDCFIAIDGRSVRRNPLYRLWKTKKFTNNQLITYLAILSLADEFREGVTVTEAIDSVSEAVIDLITPDNDISDDTIKHRLRDLADIGILSKKGKKYYMTDASDESVDFELLKWASEIEPCGVIGSFLMDREDLLSNGAVENETIEELFSFKHHVLTPALGSELAYILFTAILNKTPLKVTSYNLRQDEDVELKIAPLRIFRNVQTGRQYIASFDYERDGFRIDRLDYMGVDKTKPYIYDESFDYDNLIAGYDEACKHVWAASGFKLNSGYTKHVSFTIIAEEEYIRRRLYRERRQGEVTDLGNGRLRFDIDVFDPGELIPWVSSFICRIESFDFGDEDVNDRFANRLKDLYGRYLDE